VSNSANIKKGVGVLLSAGVLVVIFFAGIGTGIWAGTKAWHQGCIVEVNVGAKFLRSDCSSLGREGTLVDFANSAPLPLGAALKRIADMTSDKDPQRIFVPDELIKAAFAQNMVHPPTSAQRSLTVVRQLLTEAGALDNVDICVVQNGYFLRVRIR
jgi:hypothetical protein